MLKLLIADGIPQQAELVRKALEKEFVICFADGQNFRELLFEIEPDILIFDLELPGCNPMDILRQARLAGIRPAAIALTTFLSEAVSNCLESLKVSYQLRRPCATAAIVEMILDLQISLSGRTAPEQNREKDAHAMLRMLGFDRRNGYKYMVHSLLYLWDLEDMPKLQILYDHLSQVCGGTRTSIEKAMRDSIQAAWSKRSEVIWKRFFPLDRNGRIPMPSNSQFLGQLFTHLKQLTSEGFEQEKAI